MSRWMVVSVLAMGALGLSGAHAGAQVETASLRSQRGVEMQRAWRQHEIRRMEAAHQAQVDEARRVERRRRALLAIERAAAPQTDPSTSALDEQAALQARAYTALAERTRLERFAQARRAEAERARQDATRVRVARHAEMRRRAETTR